MEWNRTIFLFLKLWYNQNRKKYHMKQITIEAGSTVTKVKDKYIIPTNLGMSYGILEKLKNNK